MPTLDKAGRGWDAATRMWPTVQELQVAVARQMKGTPATTTNLTELSSVPQGWALQALLSRTSANTAPHSRPLPLLPEGETRVSLQPHPTGADATAAHTGKPGKAALLHDTDWLCFRGVMRVICELYIF